MLWRHADGRGTVKNLEKVIFRFFVILALSLNLSFFIGEIDNPVHHDVITFFLLVVVNASANRSPRSISGQHCRAG